MSLSSIRAALGAGAKASNFKITFHNMFNEDISVLVKSSQFPSKGLSTIDVPYRGRTLTYPGDVEYERTWDVTFYETEGLKIRELFTSIINRYDFNSGSDSGTRSNTFSATVQQIGQYGGVSQSYTFHNIWPKNVQALEVTADGGSTLQEQAVTFSFDYWE